jgi:hypothetical protein
VLKRLWRKYARWWLQRDGGDVSVVWNSPGVCLAFHWLPDPRLDWYRPWGRQWPFVLDLMFLVVVADPTT